MGDKARNVVGGRKIQACRKSVDVQVCDLFHERAESFAERGRFRSHPPDCRRGASAERGFAGWARGNHSSIRVP